MIGHRPVKMRQVQKAFEQAGFRNVETFGASGNVVFDAPNADRLAVAKQIEKVLEETFGYDIRVLLRTIPEIQALAKSEPFKETTSDRYTKFLITFLTGKSRYKIEIPHTSPEKDFKIIRVSGAEICSVAYLSPKRIRTGLLSFLEKTFGRDNYDTKLEYDQQDSKQLISMAYYPSGRECLSISRFQVGAGETHGRTALFSSKETHRWVRRTGSPLSQVPDRASGEL